MHNSFLEAFKYLEKWFIHGFILEYVDMTEIKFFKAMFLYILFKIRDWFLSNSLWVSNSLELIISDLVNQIYKSHYSKVKTDHSLTSSPVDYHWVNWPWRVLNGYLLLTIGGAMKEFNLANMYFCSEQMAMIHDC